MSAQKKTPKRRLQRACIHCGCTDNHACPGGCAWVLTHLHTPTGVCSNPACIAAELESASHCLNRVGEFFRMNFQA